VSASANISADVSAAVPTAPITLHYLSDSRAQRIAWLLEELSLPYTLVCHARDPNTNLAPPSLQAIHPLGKSPVLVHGGLVLAESACIVDYLIGLAPNPLQLPKTEAGSVAHRQCSYWMHYSEGSLMPLLVMNLVFGKVAKPNLPFLLKLLVGPVARGIAQGVRSQYLYPNLQRHFAYIAAALVAEKGPWLLGAQLTGADIMLGFALEAAVVDMPFLTQPYPALLAYVQHMQARPAYRAALLRAQAVSGLPYAYYVRP
jgi:glutathione S-transferase